MWLGPRRWLACLLLLVLAGCGGGRKKEPVRTGSTGVLSMSIPFEHYRLENGLEVILQESHEVPFIAVNVLYRVGLRHDPPSRAGLAHLVEHLMFEGSKHAPPGTFARELANAGVRDDNASTHLDVTMYYETVPSDRLELALWLESDRLGFLREGVTQEGLDRERKAVENERKERTEDVAGGLVPALMAHALYPVGHPYRRSATEAKLDGVTLLDVREFHRTHYLPNNAILTLAGDFDPETAKKLVQKYFGSLPRGADPPRAPRPAAVRLEREVRLRIEADVVRPYLTMWWPCPPLWAAGDVELDLAEIVLGGGVIGRLERRLVHEQRIASSVSVRHPSNELGSTFVISATFATDADATRVIETIDAELSSLAAAGPDPAELRRARQAFLTQRVFRAERMAGRAARLAVMTQSTGDPLASHREFAKYHAVTPAAVRHAVATHLRRDGRVVALVSAVPAAPRAGRLVAAQ